MKRPIGLVAIVAASILAAFQAQAQEASPPAQPSATEASAPAPATAAPNIATIRETNGRAMVNRASVYEVARKDQRLQAGDRVVVLEQGSVKVQFDSGCEVTIDTPQIYTVPAGGPCAAGVAERGLRAPTPASGTGAVAASNTDQYLKYGLIAVGLAMPLLVLSGSDYGRPISP